MKICHVCLTAGPYTDYLGYHDNLLPIYHKKLGLEVVRMIHSKKFINSSGEIGDREIKNYTDKDGIYNIVVKRSKPINLLVHKVYRFENVYNILEEVSPDIIFIHCVQFSNIFDVINYKKKHPYVRLYVDQHGDYFNMPLDTYKKKIIQYFIYGYYARCVAKYADKYWGVTPWRQKYLQDIYKVPADKTGLLVMGGEDDLIHLNEKDSIRKQYRSDLDLNDDDFVIISGGKIDLLKNIHLLVKAVIGLDIDKLKCVIFGSITHECDEKLHILLKNYPDKIKYVGWLDTKDSYNYFLMADLAFFPGTHSVLWEQALATGIPTVFKYWEGMTHVDLGGNCLFVYEDKEDEIKSVIQELFTNETLYKELKKNSVEKAIPTFSYLSIARISIEITK